MQESLVEAAVVDDHGAAPRVELLHFRVLGAALCIPLACVEKVLALMRTDPVPGAARHVRGLMRLQGEAVPLVDLAAWLHLTGTTPYDVDAPVLLCRQRGRPVALLIDAVDGVSHDVAVDQALPCDTRACANALGASVVHGDGVSLLLDIDPLLATL